MLNFQFLLFLVLLIFFNDSTNSIQSLKSKQHNCYSNRVLIGDWVNDRANLVPLKEVYKHTTTYSKDFAPKPPSRNDPAIVWDQKLKSEDSSFISQIGRNDFPNFFENFSSTYDLAFNHFPKCYKSHIPRILKFRLGRFEPNDDYIPTFGNLTKFGLLDLKRENWACEIQDPRRTYSTSYKDSFPAPTTDDYRFKRFAIPLTNSSIMDKVNQLNANLLFRGKPIREVPAAENIVEVSREPRCNPITWECPPIKKTECCKRCI